MPAQPRRTGRPSILPDIRNAIRDAALALFGDRGFEATSVGDIAAKAGVPKANVLYYFGSKDDLWREAVDTLFAEVDAFYAERWPAKPEVSLDGLAQTMRVYLEACLRWPPYVQLNNLEGHADTWRMRWLAERHLKRHIAGARNYYRRLIRAGVLPDVDTIILQNLLAGGGQLLLGQYELWRTATETSNTPEQFAEAYVTDLIRILGPRNS